jgi:hypothetical protein
MTQVQSAERNRQKMSRQIVGRDPEVRDRRQARGCTLACCHGGRTVSRGTHGTLIQLENPETIKAPPRDAKRNLFDLSEERNKILISIKIIGAVM